MVLVLEYSIESTRALKSWSFILEIEYSKFYQIAIKLANPLPKRLSHNYGTNLALRTWDLANHLPVMTIPGLHRGASPLFRLLNFSYVLGCIAHTSPVA